MFGRYICFCDRFSIKFQLIFLSYLLITRKENFVIFYWTELAAVPMVEAMVALVLVDQLMAQHAQCNLFPANFDLQESLSAKLETEEVPF